jgi:hypothetical protein
MLEAKAVQEGYAQLMDEKMLCALAMEGRFTSEGLSQHGDLCTSLAKKLLEQDGVRESASSLWPT